MRVYHVGGRKLWSVTTLLQVIRRPGLERWRGAFGNEVADKVSSDAMNFGTNVHELCEQISKGVEVTPTPTYFPYVDAYREWFRRNVREVLSVERQIVSHVHGYAGRTDLHALMSDGRTAIIDIKTSKHITPVYALQTMAYKMGIEEEGESAERRLVLQIAKPTDQYPTIGVVEWEYESDDRDRDGFLSVLALHRWMVECGMWEDEFTKGGQRG